MIGNVCLRPDEFFQSKRVITPIGTLASPAFCRDKGRMRRWVGALCLSWCMAIPPGFPADPLDHLTRTRTSTRPPHPPHPLSLQDGLRLLLHSVGKIH